MVNDIISKLLPMIRKHNIEDYQLWFCPGPGKAPRVRQGHEYPHDIRMINIQKNISSRDLRNFSAFPSLPGVIMKYLNADVQGKFILKPRNSARSQQQKNMKEKTFKKQRTSGTSQLDRSSVPHQDQVCTTPPVKMGRKLFVRELSSICQDGILPAAILVELCIRRIVFFFNMDTTKEEDVGEENRTVVCQGAAVIRRGWKRKKRYLTLFNDILVVSSKL